MQEGKVRQCTENVLVYKNDVHANNQADYLYDSLICSLDAIMCSYCMNTVRIQSIQINYFCIFIHFLQNITHWIG